MKKHEVENFWLGFFAAALVTIWLYWLWRRKREVMPEPMIISRTIKGRENTKQTQDSAPVSLKQPVAKAEKLDELDQPDALEVINGIGPTYVKRLNEAGIYTYEQLARTPVDKLQEITGVTRWDPAEWIAEAEQLTSNQ